MAYKCHKCETQILVLRLGYCGSCREPISSDILPESKQKSLAADEREYQAMRDQIVSQKGSLSPSRDGGSLFDLVNMGDYFN